MRKNKAMTALLACTLALQAPVAAGAAAPADNTAAKAVASSENTLQNAARKNGFKRENGKLLCEWREAEKQMEMGKMVRKNL